VPRVKLPFNDTDAEVEIRGTPCLSSCELPSPLTDINNDLATSLREPVSSPPLEEMVDRNDSISLLVPDITRGTSVKTVLPALIDELIRSGAENDRIEILIATGAHRPETDAELVDHLGRDIVDEFRLYQHRADDLEGNIRVGRTESNQDVRLDRRMMHADLIIPVGMVSFHYFAGFGGGRKMIMPGMAGIDSIMRNHRLSLKPRPEEGFAPGCEAANLEGNPVHQDMISTVKLLNKKIFLINLVNGPDGSLIFINAGDIFDSHLRACEYYREEFTIKLEDEFETAVVSCGGAPKDINLLQAHKTLRYASRGVKTGGDIYCLAACREGVGSSSYLESISRNNIGEGVYTLNTQTAVSTRELTENYSIYLRSELDDGIVRQFGFIPWNGRVAGRKKESVLVIGNSSLFLPEVSG